MLWRNFVRKKISLEEINCIGIGIPGKCDIKKKEIIYACNIKNLNGINIEKELREYIDLPVYINNDANCAIVGEKIFGAAKDFKDIIMITIGTGIGGGIIINNRFLENSELGHQVIVCNGEKCSCGRKGCWEAYASATGLIREAKKKYVETGKKFDLEEKFDAKFIFDMGNKYGDKMMNLVIDDYINYLSEGIANLINIFRPEVFIIGGGISNQGEDFLIKVRNDVKGKVYAGDLKTKIIRGKFLNDAGIIGAAVLYKIYWLG